MSNLKQSYSEAVASLFTGLEKGVINPILQYFEEEHDIALEADQKQKLLDKLSLPLNVVAARKIKPIAKAKAKAKTTKTTADRIPKPVSEGKWDKSIYEVDGIPENKVLNPLSNKMVILGLGTYKKLVKDEVIPAHPAHPVGETNKSKPKTKKVTPAKAKPVKNNPIKTGTVKSVVSTSTDELPPSEEMYELKDDTWFFITEPKLIVKAVEDDFYAVFSYDKGEWSRVDQETVDKYQNEEADIKFYDDKTYAKMDPEKAKSELDDVVLSKQLVAEEVSTSALTKIAADLGLKFN